MRTLIEPPLSTWSIQGRASTDPDRAALGRLINQRARQWGAAPLSRVDRIIATGHQAWLWHPGILAKDIAARLAADALDAAPLHLVPDQDAHEALGLDLPQQEGPRLRVRRVRLAEHQVGVPTGAQPPVDPAQVIRVLDEIRDDRLRPLREAFESLPPCETLAQQVALVLVRLMRPWTGDLPLLFASDLPRLEPYQRLVEEMTAQAADCVRAYNRAVAQVPQAGVAMLTVERERVELPLWAVAWRQPRQRVYADLADTEKPLLVDERGEPINLQQVKLLPKALLLTAIMRHLGCDLFIHGKGGGVYDRITDLWWRNWRNQELTPIAVVSADVHLSFDDAPIAQHADLAQAKWYRHHLPANIDRVLNLNDPLARQKRRLLEQMQQVRDPFHRWLIFREIHRINAELAQMHPEALAQADHQLQQARIGLENAAVAARRDWSFILYPPQTLQTLKDALARQAVTIRA
ncbi:MAG TPA: hypothetical protein VF184_03425 [Phycisphaeraceae bacterium]